MQSAFGMVLIIFAVMKKQAIFRILLFAVSFSSMSAQTFIRDSTIAFQSELNLQYADSLRSPLLKKDRLYFTGLDFFPVDSAYFVQAKLIRTPDEKPFEMPTTTARRPKYVKYGELIFTIQGKNLKLNVYQNVDMPRNPLYKDNLFLPFTDRTSGVESYGGGRYIDLKIPAGDTIDIDFNKAYNPYCAYNPRYSCPLVPNENDLNIEIRAGVKKFHE